MQDSDYPILTAPADGVPPVLTATSDIAAAGRALAAGAGPLAVDTERASAFRYDDRAFLIQLRRRDAGTFLIDPEANPEATRALAPQLNPLTWIIHSAPSDLPCLAQLELFPARLLDTEVAGRLLGLEKVNLAAMTETLLGISLAKGHGKEDWSTRPLPEDWINYAALDVELLADLADVLATALAETGRLEWYQQECEYIRHSHAHVPTVNPHDPQRWRSLKGIGKLTSPEQLAVARSLWQERDRIAHRRDITPTRVLPHATLVGIAETLPRSVGAISAVKGFPRRRHGASRQWLRVVEKALAAPKSSWPAPIPRTRTGRLHHRHWPERAPQVAVLFDEISLAMHQFSMATGIRQDSVVTNSELRDLAWWALEDFPASKTRAAARPHDLLPSYEDISERLLAEEKRPWQAHLVAQLVSQHVLLPRRIDEA